MKNLPLPLVRPLRLALALFSLAAVFGLSADAAVIVQYAFPAAGGTGAGNLAASTTLDDTSNTAIASGGGLGVFATDWGISSSAGNPANSHFVRSSVITGAADDYISFTVTPDAGYEMDLTSLTFDYFLTANVSTDSGTWDLRSSADGYAGILTTASATNTSTGWTTASANLSAATFQDVTTAIEFRIYFSDNNTQAGTVLRTDNITLNGGVSLVPEPSAAAAFGLGIGCLLLKIRSRGPRRERILP